MAQCLLASRMNGQRLRQVYGAPLRLRVENQLGYKMVKWIERIELSKAQKFAFRGACQHRLTAPHELHRGPERIRQRTFFGAFVVSHAQENWLQRINHGKGIGVAE